MDAFQDGSLVGFSRRFQRSPVRWVVLVHALLLVGVVGLEWRFIRNHVLLLVDASLVIAQIGLVLIWMTLNGKATMRRTLGAACVVVLIQLVHTVPSGIVTRGILCTVLSLFIMLTVLALPLSIAQWRGLQLRRFDCSNMPSPRHLQFSIRSVLVTSVGVALLFGLKGIPEMLDRWPGSTGNSFGAALAILAMGLVGSAIYLSVPLVAVWAMLTPGKVLPRLALAVVGWALGAALVFHYMQGGDGASPLIVVATATAGGIAILLATLLVMRAMRYRVVWLDRDARVIADGIPTSSPFKAEDRPVEPDATPW